MANETQKAASRRARTGWFDKYAPSDPWVLGIDIGCQDGPIHPNYIRWDRALGSGDATYMIGVPDESFRVVYASHILEHLEDYPSALLNWWRILKQGGHLIIVVPHRDLYEKKSQPPSRWNPDHKWFFLPDQDDPPRTLSLLRILNDILPIEARGEVASFEVLKGGWEDVGPYQHSVGEYSIEAIIRKIL